MPPSRNHGLVPGSKTFATFAGPLLALAAVGLACWIGFDETPGHGPAAVDAATLRSPWNPEEPWLAVEFPSLPAGELPPGWTVRRGNFTAVENEGRIMLALQPEPMSEGEMAWLRKLPGAGAIRARMRGERSRRAAPRFCLGLHGTVPFQLRAVPSDKVFELVVPETLNEQTTGEKVLATMPWQWQPDTWLWMEFRVLPPPDPAAPGGFLEGRIWNEGADRPAEADLRYELTIQTGLLSAVVQGAPYALRPIYFDRIETVILTPAENETR